VASLQNKKATLGEQSQGSKLRTTQKIIVILKLSNIKIVHIKQIVRLQKQHKNFLHIYGMAKS